MARFRIAVVGCGAITESWLPTLCDRPDVEIVALADVVSERARAVARTYGLPCAIAENVEAAVGETGANLVVNLTPPELHRPVVGAALELGCHVLGEKPMAVSFEEAQELLAIARRTQRTYAVMQNYRFGSGVRTLRDGIAGDRIGTPTFLCADFFIGAHLGGFREEMASPLLLDMAIHHFDQARFLTGMDAVAVYCREFNTRGSWYQGNASAVCVFELADASVFAYRGSWSAQGAPTSWNASWRVVGTRGTAIWDGHDLPRSEVAIQPTTPELIWESNREPWAATWHTDDGHAACITEMLDAIAAGRKPETDATDNLQTLAMTLAALTSARTGKRVLVGPDARETTPPLAAS